jgi:leucine dehydrogenase
VFQGILAAVGYRTGEPERRELKGIRVAVQGLGSVGHHLCALLADAGAELLVADIDEKLAEKIRARFGATNVGAAEILNVHADVFAPCALGAVLNEQTIPGLNVSIVAGAANNQLATERDGAALQARNILYAPDYIINAGGVINVAHEHLGLGDEAAVTAAIGKIGPRLLKIFERSDRTGRPANVIADEMARERLARTQPPRASLNAA